MGNDGRMNLDWDELKTLREYFNEELFWKLRIELWNTTEWARLEKFGFAWGLSIIYQYEWNKQNQKFTIFMQPILIISHRSNQNEYMHVLKRTLTSSTTNELAAFLALRCQRIIFYQFRRPTRAIRNANTPVLSTALEFAAPAFISRIFQFNNFLCTQLRGSVISVLFLRCIWFPFSSFG